MSTERHEQIRALLQEKGALGVNALSKEVGIPLSTMQKYLEKQTYFKKTSDRKWDLPERVVQAQANSIASNFDVVIDSQLAGINTLFSMLQTQMQAAITLISANKPLGLPVAKHSNPDIEKLETEVSVIPSALKKYKDKIPEDYDILLTDINWMGIALEYALTEFKTKIAIPLSALLLGDTRELPSDLVAMIEKHMKD